MDWCDEGKQHGPPFFTITVLALEVGPGSGARGHTRLSTRQIVSRLCASCLLKAVIRLEGAKLISLENQDTANG